MPPFPDLPRVILLGVAVGVFFALQRHNRSVRLRVWAWASIVVFLRVVITSLGPMIGLSIAAVNALDLAGMQLSGVLFALSTSRIFEDPKNRGPLLLTVGLPTVLFAVGYGLAWDSKIFFIGCAIWVPAITIGWIFKHHHGLSQPYLIGVTVVLVLTGATGIAAVVAGRVDLAFYCVHFATYAIAGYLIWKYSGPRNTAGVLLTSLSFIVWAAVFPMLYIVNGNLPLTQLINQIGSVPKYLVAIGMILMLLEEETGRLQKATEEEARLRARMQEFARITSRLLGGAGVGSICNEICAVITEHTTFERALVLLTDDQRRLYVNGSSKVDTETLRKVAESVAGLRLEQFQQVLRDEFKVGENSYRVPASVMADLGAQASPNEYSSGSWNTGDEGVVPLRTSHGQLLGCISLDQPRDPARVTADEMASIEALAADMAVAIENSALQVQLVRSEKLAGIGQLVSGAAHELNNPLTAIIGYTEMLGENEVYAESRRELDIIRREAMRMKDIIESLLRFARQGKYERRPLSLAPLLKDVLNLRAYDFRKRQIELKIEIAQDLPPVMIEEGMLKQVLLNLLNNAIDAVDGRDERRIIVEASVTPSKRVQLCVSDTGAGFPDLNRVFDPFFTTKPVGKGTGLGLSICYGIIQEHGGQITALNLRPSGACVIVELPAASAAAARLAVAARA